MISKYLKKLNKMLIITGFIWIISLFFAHNTVLAYGTWQGDETSGMPQKGQYSPKGGLLPQILKEKTFSGDADTEFPYTPWSTDVSAGTVYCADSGSAIRYGKYDPALHYANEGVGAIFGIDYTNYSSYKLLMTKLCDEIGREIFDNMNKFLEGLITKDWKYIATIPTSIGYKQIQGPTYYDDIYDIDTSKPIVVTKANAEYGDGETSYNYTRAEMSALKIATKIFKGLSNWDKTYTTDDKSTNMKAWEVSLWLGDKIDGPKAVIMETEDRAEDGYKQKGNTKIANNFTNSKSANVAYILTAMENAYSGATNSIRERYNLADIQTAYWEAVDFDGISKAHETQNGLTLFERAKSYQTFVNKDLTNFQAKIDMSQTQIITNRNTNNYIVGPITINYPYYEDISYLKSIYLKINEDKGASSKTLIYDENNDDFEIEFIGATVSGSNGLKKKYPASNAKFYVKFSAEKTNYPKTVNMYVDLEYLEKSTVKFNILDTKANVYQYIGYVATTSYSKYRLREGYGMGTVRYAYERKTLFGSYVAYKKLTVNCLSSSKGVIVVQPFVQMTEYPVRSLRAQQLRVALEGSRTYNIYTATVSAKPDSKKPDKPDTPDIDIPINLTFELGGRVWVDGTVGKENDYDGLFNKQTDTPMSNVKVSLYQVSGLDGNQSGKFIAATTTDDNGEYLFQKQNAMYQYYVKFTYNGQYYQPTVYNVNRQDSNWDNTSKGLDILKERDTFNASFREIGSAPKNTVTTNNPSEMHTRDELEEAGTIDKFGNIKGEVSSNGERKSKDEYVNQSMMDAYTCNGTSTKDLYPGFQVFVTEDFLNAKSNTAQVLKFVAAQKIETLYKNPDVMHHINLGLVLREQLDLALRKDVYKATLEINGKTQVYTYNKRDGLETDTAGNSYWEVKTRLSDASYYGNDYSRELYREDYDYKVDNYSIVDNATTLENLGLSEDSELKVYVTYKFTMRNRSENIAAAVTEVVDYYDADYTYVQDRSYLGDNDGNKIGNVYLKDASRYGVETQTTIAGYKNLYITGDQSYSNATNDAVTSNMFPLSDPDSNKDVYFYVTFMVNKDAARNILLDEDAASGTAKGVGKENIAEINGYKSYYGKKAKAPNLGNSQARAEFSQGDIAGIPDTDSTPGNLREIDISKFEDDTDKAPNIKITLNNENLRTIKGTVWEDKRTKEVNNAMVGNGKRDNGEVGINGIRVQLVEIKEAARENGGEGLRYEYIWKEIKTGQMPESTVIPGKGNAISMKPNISVSTGEYLFQGLIPGEYIVRFIYGSTDETVLSEQAIDYKTGEIITNPVTQKLGYNGETAINQKSYNGNDYKSTSYQVESELFNGVGAYKNNTSGSYMYSFKDDDEKNQSDAKDIMREIDYSSISSMIQSITDWKLRAAKDSKNLKNIDHTRENVEKYSNGDVTNELAEILASYEHLPSDESKAREYLKKFMDNTYMVAETGVINMKSEYNREESTTGFSGEYNIGNENYDDPITKTGKGGFYVLENLDFGLVERPKAQLKVTKQVTNVKMTLANNSVLFDAVERATNVLWMDHTAHGQDTKNTYSTGNNYEKNNSFMLKPIVRAKASSKGKIQLTMDQELMHGATLQITYAITVANVGEVDYKEDQFYYTGKVGDTSTIVKTNPRKLIDYVGTQVHEWDKNDDKTATRNNLQFSSELNPEWQVIDKDNVLGSLVNKKYESGVKKYTKDHIIVTEAISKDLIPLIADNSEAKDNIAKEFKENPMNALETVNASQSVSGVQLILTQMITQDNTDDDKTYNNMVELVTTKNTVGRKMAYSIVGNQDPTIEPYEIDADDSQDVVILPPFGNTPIFYVLISAVAFILIAGITITIVVLKKHK